MLSIENRHLHHIWVMRTNDGRMVASKTPRNNRQMINEVKFVAAEVQAVTIDPKQKDKFIVP